MKHLLESLPPKLTICVLGGTGFVGTELITHLAKDGHWIRVPTRSIAGNDFLRVLDTVKLIRADVHDPSALTRLFAGADVVINLIGILNEHGHKTFQSVHVNLAEKVVAAARTAELSRQLHMSSLAADPTKAPSQYLRSKVYFLKFLSAHPNGIPSLIRLRLTGLERAPRASAATFASTGA